MLPTVSVIIASSQTGATCVRELLTTYAGRVNVRAVFRTEERAAPLRAAFGDRGDSDLEVVVGVDATNPASLPAAFSGAAAALIVTPHEMEHGFGAHGDMSCAMINAAADAGVSHVALVCSWTVNWPDRIRTLSSRFL
jgi:uncharacterized protein YbjT (DUF2867 family)